MTGRKKKAQPKISPWAFRPAGLRKEAVPVQAQTPLPDPESRTEPPSLPKPPPRDPLLSRDGTPRSPLDSSSPTRCSRPPIASRSLQTARPEQSPPPAADLLTGAASSLRFLFTCRSNQTRPNSRRAKGHTGRRPAGRGLARCASAGPRLSAIALHHRMIQIFSRIVATNARQAISVSSPCSSRLHREEFSCCNPANRGIISTNVHMTPGDENLEGQDSSLAEGNNHSCSPGVQATPDIEKKYVHRVYDAIAPHFSSTRFAKWPKVVEFLNSLRPGSVVLDAGCGNGKYLGFNPQCFYVGCDISPPLIEICAGKGHEVFVADAVNMPYRENVGDAAISIAVLHHLSAEDRRRKAIEELIRVVKRGGLVLITVWAVEQEDKSLLNKWTPLCDKYNEEWVDPSSPPMRNKSATVLDSIGETDEDTGGAKQTDDQLKNSYDGLEDKTTAACCDSLIMDEHDQTQQEYFVPWHLPFHRAEISGASAAALQNGLAKKDNKKGTVVYNRYYHVFVEGELQRLVAGMKNATIVDQFYDKSNWCIVLEKL